MATVSRNEDEKEQKKEVVKIDPFGQLEDGETRKLSVANIDDAWGRSAPPPKGFYDLRLMPLSKDGATKEFFDPRDEKKGFYYQANVEFKIVSDDKELDGTPIFDFLKTSIPRGKELSTMAAVLAKCGFSPTPKGQEETTDGKLLAKFAKASSQMPIIKGVMINWKASYQDSNNRWQVPYKDYDQFPDDGEDGKMFEVEYRDGGKRITLNAKAYIQWNVRQGEAKNNKVTSIAKEVEKLDEGVEEKLVSQPRNGKNKPAPVEITDDDLERL